MRAALLVFSENPKCGLTQRGWLLGRAGVIRNTAARFIACGPDAFPVWTVSLFGCTEFTLLLGRRATRWASDRQYLLGSEYVAYHDQDCSTAVAMNAVRFCSIVLVTFGKRSSGGTTDNGSSALVTSNGLKGVSY